MSGSLLGDLSALGVYGAGAAVYLAGKLTVKAVKGLIAGGKLVYNAYEQAERKRRNDALRELNAVQGEIGRMAARRQEEFMHVEHELDLTLSSARDSDIRQWQSLDAAVRSASVQDKSELAALESRIQEASLSFSSTLKQDVHSFERQLNQSLSNMDNQIETDAGQMRQNIEQELTGITNELERRREADRRYAIQVLSESQALLNALEHIYDCNVYAPASYCAMQSYLHELKKLTDQQSWDTAATVAGTCQINIQLLHAELERKTAQFARSQYLIKQAVENLEQAQKASGDLLTDAAGNEMNELKKYVKDGRDVLYWSNGEMKQVWDDIDRFREMTAQLKPGCQDVTVEELLRQASALTFRMEKVNHKARAFLNNRLSIEKIAQQTVRGYAVNGWTCRGADYIDHDPRKDVLVTFVNKEGDQRQVLIHSEYDEQEGTYKGQLIRYCAQSEDTMPDESVRRQDDEQINASMISAGVDERLIPRHCKHGTEGRRSVQ